MMPRMRVWIILGKSLHELQKQDEVGVYGHYISGFVRLMYIARSPKLSKSPGK